MNAAGCGTRPALHLRVCPLPSSCASFSGKGNPGRTTLLADFSRLGSNSHASSSAISWSSCGRVRRVMQTECALQSVPFKPSKLTVHYLPGTAQSGQCPLQPRRYTLTHNDLTGQLLLRIGHQYNTAQLSGWYNRLLRDEILAYWQFTNERPVLHIECHVSGEETWLAPPILRDYIFRREMPLVLNVINFAEAGLLADNPVMADAQVMVHLSSHVKVYHTSVVWGSLSDCTSWQPPPQWTRTRAVMPPTPTLMPSIGTTSLTECASADPSLQGWSLAVSDEPVQDQPCILPATDADSAICVSPADSTSTVCQQQADSPGSTSTQSHSNNQSTSFPVSDTSVGRHRKSRHYAACYRLHVACTAALRGLPVHTHAPVGIAHQHSHMHCSIVSGLAYHVPPRLSRYQ